MMTLPEVPVEVTAEIPVASPTKSTVWSLASLSHRATQGLLQGLLLVTPLVVTGAVGWWVVGSADRLMAHWIEVPVPGMGFVVALLGVTLLGIVGSHVLGQWLMARVQRVIQRIPLLRVLHASTKDVMGAMVGDGGAKRLDRPVLVPLGGGGAYTVGFMTVPSLIAFGLPAHCCVLVPQAFNWAGNLVVAPVSTVIPLSVPASDVMAFIVSGSLAGANMTSASGAMSPS